MEYEVGIDEAGRGPVIGPMVYACCAWPIDKKDKYGKLGFMDSKVLTEGKRDQLLEVIQNLDDTVYLTEILSPEYISNMMLRRVKVSLNVISMDSAEKLVQGLLDKGIKVINVYVDTVGKPESYEARLKSRFRGINFTVRAKADSLFPVVSAASIVAKVTRDRIVNGYIQELGEIGSGYPSDPNTQAWLKSNLHPVFGYPSKFVRISWKTCTTAMEELPKVEWSETQQPNPFYYYEKLGLSDTF